MMRLRGMLLVISFFTGVLTMSEVQTAVARQEKKDEPKKDEKFPERVTYRKWVVQGVNGKDKFFLPDVKDRPARYQEIKGVPTWFLVRAGLPGKVPTSGSEIVDKDGNIFVVTKVTEGASYICECTKKELPKKD